MEWDVFAAHASVDKPRVRPIVAALRGDGLRVFLDEDSIPVGEAWDVVLPAALRASRATVVFLSAAYEAAFYRRVEAHQALGRRRAGERETPAREIEGVVLHPPILRPVAGVYPPPATRGVRRHDEGDRPVPAGGSR